MKKYTETVEQKEKIIDNYVNKKWGLLKSGAEFGFSKNLTKRILVENGIKIRNNSEAHRVYSLNEEYFNYESHNMAYILGFIAADGTVREKSNEIKITLSSVDKELLEKIREELNSDRPLREYSDNNGYSKVELDFTSPIIKSKLKEYGIIPNKTYSLKPPYKLNEDFIPDYIRGYFDGDGCITRTGYKGNGIEFKIVSACREILAFFEEYFNKKYNQNKSHIYTRKKEETKLQLYDLRYSTNFSKELYNILYTPNSLYLKRKKEKYEQLLMK